MTDVTPRTAAGFIPPVIGDLPVGSVVPYAGTLGPPDTLPSPSSPPQPAVGALWPLEAWGWTLCDGRSLPVAQYPELYAALGYLYGGSGNSFSLPDYRGYFMRGIDGGSKRDPDIGDRTAAPGGQSSGVGSTQQFALQTHAHDYMEATPAGPGDQGTAAGAPGQQAITPNDPVTKTGATVPVQVSQNETRPINIYVNFIIKFTAGLRPTPFNPHLTRRSEHGL